MILDAVDVLSGKTSKPLDADIKRELQRCDDLQKWLICEIFENRDPSIVDGEDSRLRQEGRSALALELIQTLREE